MILHRDAHEQAVKPSTTTQTTFCTIKADRRTHSHETTIVDQG